MKILIIILRWKGGVGRVIKSIIPILESKGYEVDVISREEDLGIGFNEGNFIKGFLGLRKEVKLRNYDVLYTQDWSCALPFIFYKNHYSCFHGHNLNFPANILQTLIGDKMGNKLFVVGDSLKERFPESRVLYNGVDKKIFYDLKKRRKYLGWIDKETEEIDLEYIKKLSKELNLEYSVVKDIPHKEMNKWYNSLKVFVSKPPKTAGFNLCWLEAKASGVPKILGNENGIGIDKLNSNFKEFTWENNVNKFKGIFELELMLNKTKYRGWLGELLNLN